MKPKFLIISTLQSTIEGFLIPHIKFLENKGYEVWIATNMSQEIPKELEKNKWKHINFSRNPFSKNSFLVIRDLKKLMIENRFEGIHCHTPVAAFLSRFTAKITKQKNIIYTAHGFHFYKGASLVNWLVYYPLEWIAARWTDKLITINEEDYQRAQKFFSPKTKIYKIEGIGLELEKYTKGNREKIRKELRINTDEAAILIIGELNKNKNQIQMIRALEILKNKGEKVRGIFVGTGNQEYLLRQEAEKRGIRIEFLGFRKDIKDIISASDIMASMSYREGLPRNIMEGMVQGKPFIATDIRGNRDLISNGINGYLVPVGDEKATAENLYKIIRKDDRKKIEKNNRKRSVKYSIKYILKEIEKIYGDENENSISKS